MKIQKMLIAASMIVMSLNAQYGDVNMVNPDMVGRTPLDAPIGVGESPETDNLPSPQADKARAKSRLRKRKKCRSKATCPAPVKDKIISTVHVPVVKDITTITVPKDAYLVDAIEAVVFAPEGTKIVTHSELGRPSLDGKIRTLEELIFERLMLLDAQKFKMVPDDEIIDKHLAAVQRDNNLTLEDLKNVFKAAGYSYEEGREQFGMISIINQILDFKIRSRLIVPEKEVIAYHIAHPEIEDASYHVQIGIIPFGYSQTHEEQKQFIEQALVSNIDNLDIEWQEPFWIEKNEIAHDKDFLISMAPGTISVPDEAAQGFQVFRKIEEKAERTKTLEERYRSIVDVLRRPKYEQLYNEYKQQLTDTASVKYLNS